MRLEAPFEREKKSGEVADGSVIKTRGRPYAWAALLEYVIESALKDSNNVLVIVLKNEDGRVVPTRITAPTVLPSISCAEVNYNAFGILSTDYHNQLYGYLQSKTGNHSVKACDEYIVAQADYYNPSMHLKRHIGPRDALYSSLPTYIRNAIHHPDSGNTYTEDELRESIELLIKLCRQE